MGTRSLTIIDGGSKEIAVMYRQYDGYPEGHGRELAQFLAGFRITNGFGEAAPKLANGMECLAAQIVAHFKTETGNIYLSPAGTRDCGEEFRYLVYGAPGMEPKVRAEKVHGYRALEGEAVTLLFDGPASELLAWINQTRPEVAA